MKITLTATNKLRLDTVLDAVRGPKFWKFAATEWHRLYKDWVPMKSGILYSNVHIEPKTITHMAPYAHYMYKGKTYGPNLPITEGDRITGYFSVPNRRKKPTGKPLRYNHQFHGKASAKWDRAAKPTQMPLLVKTLQRYIDTGGLDLE